MNLTNVEKQLVIFERFICNYLTHNTKGKMMRKHCANLNFDVDEKNNQREHLKICQELEELAERALKLTCHDFITHREYKNHSLRWRLLFAKDWISKSSIHKKASWSVKQMRNNFKKCCCCILHIIKKGASQMHGSWCFWFFLWHWKWSN